MRNRLAAVVSMVLMLVATSALGEGLFEETLAVEVEKGLRGPRGMPGDIVQLGDGSLLMAYTRDGGIVGIKSADVGKTWGEPFVMFPKPKPPAKGYFAHPGFLRLANGEILVSYIHSLHPATPYFATVYYRRSADQGRTWSQGQPIKQLKMPYAGLPTVRRIPSTGDLLFVWISRRSVDKNDPKIARRSALSSAISKDEGKSFEHQRNIACDPEDDFGYQCVEFIGDDLAVMAYHARAGLRVARIGIDWFYAVQ